MLYTVSVYLKRNEDDYPEFFRELEHLGDNIQVHRGMFFLESITTPEGIKSQLLPHIGRYDKIVIAPIYSGVCAGNFSGAAKRFYDKYSKPYDQRKAVEDYDPIMPRRQGHACKHVRDDLFR